MTLKFDLTWNALRALLLALLLSLIGLLPAEAALCRDYHQHQICVLSIKRSAKNYWEYRASLRVDGFVRPVEVYDCRHRLRIQKKGVLVSFSQDAASDFVCTFFK
ncbi:MAG: hypothetical protein KME43_22625 [Myxacorys chilensis ATA2-1-KO14]|nr:hypothetical protein [Myxacorys chilensis ATA2-1-KO14]